MELQYDPAIPLLEIYQKNTRTLVHVSEDIVAIFFVQTFKSLVKFLWLFYQPFKETC